MKDVLRVYLAINYHMSSRFARATIVVSRVLEYNLQEACICVYLWLKCSSRDSFANITEKEERLFDNRASFKLDKLPEFKQYKFDLQLEIS